MFILQILIYLPKTASAHFVINIILFLENSLKITLQSKQKCFVFVDSSFVFCLFAIHQHVTKDDCRLKSSR